MSNSYRALCADFYINQRLNLKMDLPMRRDTVLSLFDRIRREIPSLDKFRRYQNELSLESGSREPAQQWLGVRRTSIRSGSVNPESPEDSYRLHRLVLETAPYFLDISPLDIEYLEVLYGFDLLASGNHDAIVYEALFAGSPIAQLVDSPNTMPTDFQPVFGVSLTPECDVHAQFEVKTRTSARQVRSGDFREEPISVYLTVRRQGPVSDIHDLATALASLTHHAQDLLDNRVVPHLIVPIRNTIASGSA
ncbi:MAG: hypothetical protein KF745_02070 [Phycisphaeraceae bacterium]|nr:hypothetical protein [Phycisphaeraceae bacterium]